MKTDNSLAQAMLVEATSCVNGIRGIICVLEDWTPNDSPGVDAVRKNLAMAITQLTFYSETILRDADIALTETGVFEEQQL